MEMLYNSGIRTLIAAAILAAAPIPPLRAAGEAILGRIQPVMTEPIGGQPPIRLVHHLDPDDAAILKSITTTLVALAAEGYRPNDRPSSPANHPLLKSRIQNLDTKIPRPASRTIQLGKSGLRMFTASNALILRYRTLIGEIRPETYSDDLFALAETVSADLHLLRRTVATGFVGDAEAINLLGITSTGTRVDSDGAAIVGQAIVNLAWLVAFADALGAAFPTLLSPDDLVDPAVSHEAAWDLFRIAVLPDLRNRIDLATINQTVSRPDGQFALRGEGVLLVTVPAFGQLLPIPEGTPDLPFQIERIQP